MWQNVMNCPQDFSDNSGEIMLYSEYKCSIKNILRSTVFWLSVAVLIIVAIYEATEVSITRYDPELNELLLDKDPRFVLTFYNYVQTVINACVSNVMLYAMPVVTVISASVLLRHDYGDGFYEIQKSSGVKPYRFLLGRILALLTINFVLVTLAVALSLYVYVFSRGGVEGMTNLQIISDSISRILRVVIFIAMPCIAMYIGLTYFTGCIFKNHISAAVTGLAYVIIFYATNLWLRFRVGEVYFDYLSPLPRKIRQYLHYYDTGLFENTISQSGVTFAQAAISVSALLGIALVFYNISYLRIRKRTI